MNKTRGMLTLEQLKGMVAQGEIETVVAGFTDKLLRSLHQTLVKLERPTPPFEAGAPLPRSGVHWVEPRLVGQVGFSEWTRDLELRHPRFQGLRDDKDPADVVREVPTSGEAQS